jgi:small subunit ribosomal protein S6e
LAKLKIIVSDPKSSKSQVIEVEGVKAQPLIGRKIGETLDGSIVGLGGQNLKITGGSDKDGVPMRFDVQGGVRVNAILSGGVGFHPQRRGERMRKLVRGNTITDEIVQVNMNLLEKPIDKKPEETKEEVKQPVEKAGKKIRKAKAEEKVKVEHQAPKTARS